MEREERGFDALRVALDLLPERDKEVLERVERAMGEIDPRDPDAS